MRFTIYLVLVLLPCLAFSQEKMEQHYKIYSVAKAKVISLDEIAADFAAADVLFFGEVHTDSVAHYLEYTLLKKLVEKYPGKMALSMEMFETDCQPVVNEYFKGLIKERNFMIDGRAWKNYDDYRPCVELARLNKIDLIAANAPARYTNMVSRMGLKSLNLLDSAGKSHLPPLPIDTAAGKYYQKFLTIMGGHSTMGGMQVYQSQNLWDATMGWSIARYLKGHNGVKVFHLNGGFHSEEKLGSPAQLKRYAANTRIFNIASLNGNKLDNPDWKSFANLGDYIILTDD